MAAVEEVLSNMAAASANVKKAFTMKNGGQAAENRYYEAYEGMCRAGLRTPLRAKYRKTV